MLLIDRETDRAYSLESIKADYTAFIETDPVNHCNTFRAELCCILIDSMNGRNNLIVAGYTQRETENIIKKLLNRGNK